MLLTNGGGFLTIIAMYDIWYLGIKFCTCLASALPTFEHPGKTSYHMYVVYT
jgi:hypothetical protein